nr:hypothetical protein [Microctonus hyperodae filamentous virus]
MIKFFAMPTTTLVVFLIFCSCGRSDDASVKYIRHGYVQIPASRAYLCMKHINVNCSDIIYEPQSIEQPTATILDGSTPIASGGNEKFSALDEYGVNRWNRQILHVYSYNQSHALFLLKWHFTAMHKTDLFYIHLTNRNYNVKEKLSKKMFEVERFCLSNAQGLIDNDYAMMCIVPKSQICCVDGAFLAVWVIGDTPNSHTQIVDVRFTIHHTNNTIHNDWNQTTPEDTTTSTTTTTTTMIPTIPEDTTTSTTTTTTTMIPPSPEDTTTSTTTTTTTMIPTTPEDTTTSTTTTTTTMIPTTPEDTTTSTTTTTTTMSTSPEDDLFNLEFTQNTCCSCRRCDKLI